MQNLKYFSKACQTLIMCLCTIYYVIIPLVAHLNLVRQSLSSPSQGRSLLLLSVFFFNITLLSVFKGLSHYCGRYILIIWYIFFFCSILENLLVQTSVVFVFAINRKSTHHIPLSSTKDKTFIVSSTCFKSTKCPSSCWSNMIITCPLF